MKFYFPQAIGQWHDVKPFLTLDQVLAGLMLACICDATDVNKATWVKSHSSVFTILEMIYQLNNMEPLEKYSQIRRKMKNYFVIFNKAASK